MHHVDWPFVPHTAAINSYLVIPVTCLHTVAKKCNNGGYELGKLSVSISM